MQQLLGEIADAVEKVYRDAVDPLGEKFAFEKRPSAGEISGPPMVLFLGNHSSGKSTFINHLMGSAVQKTGLAPTDDAFTVLRFGGSEEDRDGPAAVSNPDLPYQGLRQFGADFLSHFRVKLRPVPLLHEVNLVDSPGMIDAAKEGSGRGYDFSGAVRWFAERADVVLFFFDPDKPGTTGETLQVFTQALQGLDHKLQIVMNKVDLLRGLHDFARAYGALCWNLGKVIPRKDLPHIHTAFVPTEAAPPPALPMKDFEEAREELVKEVRRAPARRVDNMLTRLEDHARRLLLHVQVVADARRSLRRFRLKLWGMFGLFVAFALLAGGVSLGEGVKPLVTTSIFGGAVLLAYVGYFAMRGIVKMTERQTAAGLQDVFERLHARDLLVEEKAEDLRGLWAKVHPRTKQAMEKLGLLSFPALPREAEARLVKAAAEEIPQLRAKLHRELSAGGRG